MKYKTILVDDEELARKRIADLLKGNPDFELVEQCKSGQEAIKCINSTQPQVVFLDIHLKDMNGIEALNHLTVKSLPIIVFITAYDEYAVQAFNLHAIDYILKPFKNERFFECLDILKTKLSNNYEQKLNDVMALLEKKPKGNDKLLITQNNKTLFVDVLKIKYILSSSYYAEIYTDDEKKYVIRESLKNLIKNLDTSIFHRIHRSTIININFASELLHSGFNETDIRMKDNKVFRISKSHKTDFLKKIGAKE
ncbi:response regulator [Galbibacter sp. EGI 63066]|uniref:LytR/AlgR family response regulator transcription factor n=1 Tax=Galbibacter sp. EGI 63066 TaxID=2993559 RepID=UPI0022491BBC|nr:response regulator [Galbibacter sp. EGI 63066]MCX2679800.1 response regulator [Galbibacter sp. EGI 63066]